MEKSADLAAQDAAVLSATEIGLGSIVHAFHLPLAGHLLSLNQGFLLSRSVLKSRGRAIGLHVSNVAALLKSLSPAGPKLTPMLAISTQGALFSLGTALLGANPAGTAVGAALMSVWGFAQPVLLASLLFGATFFGALHKLYLMLQEAHPFDERRLLTVLVAVVALKAVLAAAASLAAWWLPASSIERYQTRLLSAGQGRRRALAGNSADASGAGLRARLAARDLLNPMFLVSTALMTVFALFADSRRSELVWVLLRPLAAGFVLFFLARSIPFERFPRVARALKALRQI